MKANPPDTLFSELARFDSCAVANAVGSLGLSMLNEGFSGSGITCRTPGLPPMAGVALTFKVRSSDPSMKPAFYLEGPDWWEKIEKSDEPRVLVIQDMDAKPGRGSLVGPTHACIIHALGFVGVVTSGAVRGVAKFAELGMGAFSGNLSPSHAFSHVIEIGGPVEIAGARIKTGDIIHGDGDGIVCIPSDVAHSVPAIAKGFAERERTICRFCNSDKFSREQLRSVILPDSSRR